MAQEIRSASTAAAAAERALAAPMPWHVHAWSAAAAASAPALLLHGPAGIGERVFAIALAQAWLCEAPAAATRHACGTCPSCHLLAAGNHPDLRVIEPAALVAAAEEADDDPADGEEKARSDRKPSKEIRVDQLRALIDLAQITSHRGGARVVIIHPVDAMNVASSNALLKLLEEPPAGLRFVLVAHRLQRVSATVLSRCMRVALRAPGNDLAIEWLVAQGVDDAQQALAVSGGAPLLAQSNADPVRAATYRAWLRCISDPSIPAIAAARDTKDAGPPQVLAWMLQWTHDMARVKAGAEPRYHPQHAAVLAGLVATLPLRSISRLHRTLLLKQRWIRHPLNAQLALEALWLDYQQRALIR
jgi:DNA polymerase-3 subunit delta'